MNVSKLVHDIRQTSKFRSIPPSQRHITVYHPRGLESYGRDMASALTASPYSSQATPFARAPQPPPSPPAEDPNTKCTLPSIQSLIGMASDPATTDLEQQRKSLDPPKRLPSLQSRFDMPFTAEAERPASQQQFQGDHLQSTDFRSQNQGHSSVSNPGALPPSPPVRMGLDFDGSSQSPSAASSQSSTAVPTYYGSAINNLEPHQQRHGLPPSSMAGNPMFSQVPQPSYQPAAYPPSPATISNYSYPSPVHTAAGVSSMYYQRTLPSTFPPPSLPAAMGLGLPSHDVSPIDHGHQWQHHHYISPSSSAAFASQSQDRYVCQTCNKAFSRPSSLRIHSHSHTGEKPFKCPHTGCGKAFSVRSNMKRHERGCHGSGSPEAHRM